MSFIENLAFRFRNNKLLILLVRPLWRLRGEYRIKRDIKSLQKNGPLFLHKVKEIFDQNNIEYWLEFGTLLGAYREHGLIKHDYDLDIGVFFENTTRIASLFEKEGIKLRYEYKVGEDGKKGFLQTFDFKGIRLDIYYYHKENGEVFCNTFTPFTDEHRSLTEYQVKHVRRCINGIGTIKLFGEMYSVPSNIEECLVESYGKNYMIPDPNYDGEKYISDGIVHKQHVFYYPYEERVGILRSWE